MKSIEFHTSHAVWIDEPALFADVVFPDICKMEQEGIQGYAGMFQNGLQGAMMKKSCSGDPVRRQEPPVGREWSWPRG